MQNKILDFKNSKGNWITRTTIDGIVYFAQSHITWNHMKQRCNVGGHCQRNNRTYIGCTMSSKFSNFQSFTDWHIQQVGYTLDYSLDKDLLRPKNKLYSEDTCILIPKALNTFIVSSSPHTNLKDVGTCYVKSRNKFQASINIDGKDIYLGIFQNQIDAHQAYKEAKENEAHRWFKRLCDKEFIVDERVIERMRTWKLEDLY